jgi:hypothetical protein
MKLIEPQDPRYFTETCSKSYDRHEYKVVGKYGKSTIVKTWMEAQALWWNNKPFLSHIEVLDKVVENDRKGFK